MVHIHFLNGITYSLDNTRCNSQAIYALISPKIEKGTGTTMLIHIMHGRKPGFQTKCLKRRITKVAQSNF